jgi:hypothetical protein
MPIEAANSISIPMMIGTSHTQGVDGTWKNAMNTASATQPIATSTSRANTG